MLSVLRACKETPYPVIKPIRLFGSVPSKKALKGISIKKRRRRNLFLLDSKWHPLWKGMEGDRADGKYIYKLCNEGKLQEAVFALKRMEHQGEWADLNLYASVLKSCTKDKALSVGRDVHGLIRKVGLDHDPYLAANLTGMYAKCGNLSTAQKIFNAIPEPRASTWTAMIMGYASDGQFQKALDLFAEMRRQGVEPNEFTFIGLLKACAGLPSLEQGKKVLALISESDYTSHLSIQNTLIDMYAKCGAVNEALQLFNKMAKRDIVSWNNILMACSKCEQAERTLELYQEMQKDGLKPDTVTFLAVLNACTSLTALEQGKQIHAQIRESGLESDVVVANKTLHMYAKCGSIENVHEVFSSMSHPDVVSYNVVVAAYAKYGLGRRALSSFYQMLRKGLQPDGVTFVALVNACAVLLDIEQGKYVHKLSESSGYASNVYVRNALIDMYAKCGSIADALAVFNCTPVKTVVSWNTIIMGCARNSKGMLALELFEKMQTSGIKPNSGTLAGVLKGCSSLLSLEQGKWYHLLTLHSGLGSNLTLGNTLIEMYSRLGSLKDACDVFKKMPVKNVDSWNLLIRAHLKYKDVHMALKIFQEMKSQGIQPDKLTNDLLSSCGEDAMAEYDELMHCTNQASL